MIVCGGVNKQTNGPWLLDKFSNRVQFLLFPTESWNDKKLSLLQMYKAHVGKLGTDAVKVWGGEGLQALKGAFDPWHEWRLSSFNSLKG